MSFNPDDLFASEQSARAAVDKLLASRKVNAARDWSAPLEEEQPPPPLDFRLKWGSAAELTALGVPLPARAENPMSLDDFRRYFPQRMEHLMSASYSTRHINLLAVPAGAGKTHAAVHAAQALAASGKRVLWLSPRRDGFGNIAASIPNFDHKLWYNWRAMSAIENDQTQERTCRLFDSAMGVWLDKGYPAGKLCLQLCPTWAASCPFRTQCKQAKRRAIVFARHQHLIYGVDAGKFHAVVIDESPLGALIKERLIPAGALPISSSSLLVVELAQKFAALAAEGALLKGPALLARIEDELNNIYTMADLDGLALPEVPRVGNVSDVGRADYWYIIDALRLLEQEFNAHVNGWQTWEPRVWVDGAGLHMIERADVHEKTPHNVTILDATGSENLYSQMFPAAQIATQRPSIKRLGKIRQIVNRNYNQTDATSEVKRLDALATVLAIMAIWRYKMIDVFIVCHKIARAFWESHGFQVMHFGALRGENSFQNKRAGFVIGVPSPPAADIRRIASVLSNDIRATTNARHTVQPRAFAVAGASDYPYRLVGGFWGNDAMSAVHQQAREAEAEQAAYRIRPHEGGDVWLLNSTPVTELDEVFADPRAATGGLAEADWISGKAWVRLAPFIVKCYEEGRAFTIDNLADVLSPDDVDRREKVKRGAQSGKWLDKIAAVWGGDVARAVIPNRRGRPPLQVVPNVT